MVSTKTGSFAIGYRLIGSPWQRDLSRAIEFATASGFECLDVGAVDAPSLRSIRAAGLAIGSADLPGFVGELITADLAKRKRAVDRAIEFITMAAAEGVRRFFTVLLPDDVDADRETTLGQMVEAYGPLCEVLTRAAPDGRIVIEGYPGRGPQYAALGCTPESLRAIFARLPNQPLGINFDPSHLVRMGIDPERFLREFGGRVGHVHAKDCQLLPEGAYEFGILQSATLARPHAWGGHAWRYVIPGHGQVRWPAILQILADNGYRGFLSVELEDEEFNGTPGGEMAGLIASRDYLARL
jgi:sugar phosphate isomerase/epimerase